MVTPYQSLANAIIEQAATDYRKYRKRIIRYPHDTDAKMIIRDCVRFFSSDWICCLTSINGTFILQKLENEFT